MYTGISHSSLYHILNMDVKNIHEFINETNNPEEKKMATEQIVVLEYVLSLLNSDYSAKYYGKPKYYLKKQYLF